MKNVFRNGMFFTAIGQYSIVLIQLIINVILSRIIPVEEFGVVANVQVFLIFFQILATAGIGPAIIQNDKIKEEDYGVIFNYTILLSIISAIAFGLLGHLIAYLYKNPIYNNLFWCMSVIIFSEGMNVVPTAILNKELRFRTLNLRLLFCNLVGSIFGIIAAFSGLGVYSLIISMAVPAVATLFANFAVVKLKYTKSFDPRPIKEIWGFARNQLGYTVLNYFARNSDNLFIGKFLGPTPLAIYQKSYQLVTMPNTVFLGVISPVLQPVLSKHQDDVKLIRETFLSVVHILALIGFPLTAFMVLNAREIILLLFGSNWVAAITPLTIFGFSIWAQMLTAATGSIFMARNHSHTMLKNGVIGTSLIVGLTLLGIISRDINVIAFFVCLAYILYFLISYWILMTQVLDGSLLDVFKEISLPAGIGVITALLTFFLNPFISYSSNFVTLLLRGILWLIILAGLFFFSGEFKKLKTLL